MIRSLQFRLSAWLCGVILLVALAGGAFSFVSAFHEANELQDDQLRQIAALIHQRNLPLPSARLQETEPVSDSDSRVIVQTLTRANAPPVADHAFSLPDSLPDGMQTLTVQGEPWRIYVGTLTNGTRIAVSQQTAVRDEIARDSALRTVMPFIILMPLLLLVVGLLIKQVFMPVKRLAADLDHRPDHDLRALSDATLPSEIVPFVVAINRLLGRVEGAVALQRRFMANAAHELRSPLTALSLQAERLDVVAMPDQARERLAILKTGIYRARALLDQLLSLARAQEIPASSNAETSVRHALRQVLEDMVPLAEQKSIDIGVIADEDANVRASELDLRTLIRNLIDNAIRYTPPGGRVDLSVTASKGLTTLSVVDTGPGIPDAEKEQVFDPFYRVLGNQEIGSGLGLSIVKAIADRIGASVLLADANKEAPVGLNVAVIFEKS